MRPIDRGDAPREYTEYGQAIGDLEDRLGLYCSYCERRLPASLEVEHVAPKSRRGDQKLLWSNFLLGCKSCNTVKGKQATNQKDFLWPDRDNTCRAFRYESGGFVKLAKGLRKDARAKACRLKDIVGLDRHQATNWPRPSRRDNRWQQREEVWSTAMRCRQLMLELNQDAAQELVVNVALGYGFFSVWLTVFANETQVRTALINRFRGTSTGCFDATGGFIRRKGGHL